MFNKMFIGIIISLSLSGCSVEHSGFEKYKEKELTQLYPINENYKIKTDWWKDYNDEQLNSLISLALKNNIDLTQSAITSNIALYNANLIGADLLPTFSSSLGASTQKNIKNGSGSIRSFNGSVGISYELDLWKKLSDSKDAKEWEYNATIEDVEDAKLALINNIIDGYFKLKYLKESKNITQESINNYQKILDISNKKFNVGIIGNLDVLQAEQSVQNSLNNMNNIELQIKEIEITLKNLINFQPNQSLFISKTSIFDIPLQKVDINIPVSTIANRPDLRASEYRLMESFKDKQVVEKNIYPDITIGSTLNSSGNKINSTFNIPIASANISINLPFLDWNRIKWNSEISQEQFESRKLDFIKNITLALNEIDNYYYNYSKNVDAYSIAKKQYDISSKITKNYEDKYKAGIVEISDWLNALQTEYSAKQTLIEERYTLLSGENNVYKSMAGKYRY